MCRVPKRTPQHKYDYSSAATSLPADWVLHNFEKNYLHAVKKRALSDDFKFKPIKFCHVPPGDPKDSLMEVPIHLCVIDESKRNDYKTIKFFQGNDRTCLLDSFCSALYSFGLTEDSIWLNQNGDSLIQSNLNLMDNFISKVNKALSVKYQLKMRLLGKAGTTRSMSIESLLNLDDSFPIIATLIGNNGMFGQHAISIFNGQIFDSSSQHRLKKSKDSLDWCVSGGEACVECIGTYVVYQLRPKTEEFECKSYLFKNNLRGWICGRKSGKFKVMFTDGSIHQYTNMALMVDFMKN